MTKGQKIIMWIFGLIIAFSFLIYGTSITDQYGYETPNGFVAGIIPITIIGLMFFFSFGKKKQ